MNPSKKLLVFLLAALICSAASAVWADTMLCCPYQPQYWGASTLSQTTLGITNGSVACGPTSVYNSWQYLQQRYGISLSGTLSSAVITGAGTLAEGAPVDMSNDIATANQFGIAMDLTNSGVWPRQFVNGKGTLMSLDSAWRALPNPTLEVMSVGTAGMNTSFPGVSTLITQGIPTAQFIYNMQQAGEDVELDVNWYKGTLTGSTLSTGTLTGGGHYIDQDSLCYDLSTGSGSIGLRNPQDGNQYFGTLQSLPPGTWVWSGTNAINVGNRLAVSYEGDTGLVYMVVAESIPEPSTLAMLGTGALGASSMRGDAGAGGGARASPSYAAGVGNWRFSAFGAT